MLVLAIVVTILDWLFIFPPINFAKAEISRWGTLIGGFLIILAVFILLRRHTRRISRMEFGTQEFWHSVTLWGSFLLFFGLSVLLEGGRNHTSYRWLYDNIINPFNLAQYRGIMMAYTVLAAYYALKVNSLETTVFLASGIIWLMWQVPLGNYLVPQIVGAGDWISNVPNTAGARAAALAIAVGGIMMGLRTLVGKEPGLIEEDVT